MLSDALELAGMTCLVAAAFLLAIPLGIAAAGVACLVIGLALDARSDK